MNQMPTGMPLDVEVGQMMMLGFEGELPTAEFRLFIREYRIGGVVLFERNCRSPEQLWSLCAGLQDHARSFEPHLPLFVAVDQEGGRVLRLGPPFTRFPSARRLGRAGDETLVAATARAMAREMLAVGINMNLAPVLDVDSNPENPVIADRAFHAIPAVVARMGVAFVRALQEEGVVATGKHFPGHGDTAFDSHLDLGAVEKTAEQLEAVELVPFRAAIGAGLEAVMTAHVAYSAWDKEMPATLSQAVLGRLLRGELGYRGMVMTDDLAMGAISRRYTIQDAAVIAVRAGADMLLLCAGLDEQVRMVEVVRRAAEVGEIPRERISSAAGRILGCKQRYIFKREPRPQEEVRAVVGCPEHIELARHPVLATGQET